MAVQLLFGRDGALITSAGLGETLVWNAGPAGSCAATPSVDALRCRRTGAALALALNSHPARQAERLRGAARPPHGRHRQLATELPEEWIFSLAFTRDGTRIVAPSSQGTHVWDVASGEIIESYRDGAHGRHVQRHRDRSAWAGDLHVR